MEVFGIENDSESSKKIQYYIDFVDQLENVIKLINYFIFIFNAINFFSCFFFFQISKIKEIMGDLEIEEEQIIRNIEQDYK